MMLANLVDQCDRKLKRGACPIIEIFQWDSRVEQSSHLRTDQFITASKFEKPALPVSRNPSSQLPRNGLGTDMPNIAQKVRPNNSQNHENKLS
jgi:hypothetical protein